MQAMKKMWRAALGVFLAAAVCSAASAQAPAPTVSPAVSPTVQHYRAYAAAREAKNFTLAQTEAVAALAAAEATGDPRTGILAFNLATLRAFELHDLVGARAPAEKALTAGDAGVSPSNARLLIQLSDLPQNQEPVRRALNAVMVAAQGDAAADVDFLYQIARAWGYAALAAGREESALEAYTHARDLANRATGDAVLDRAFAAIEMGALLIVRDRVERAYDLFTEAANMLAPRAVESTGRAVSATELLYGEAITWRSVAYAKASNVQRQRMNDDITSRPEAPGLPKLCKADLRASPLPKYPRAALGRLGIGAVTVRLSVGPEGAIRRVQVIGAVPREDFTESVLAVASRWRVRWIETSPGCRRDTDGMLVPLRFVFQ